MFGSLVKCSLFCAQVTVKGSDGTARAWSMADLAGLPWREALAGAPFASRKHPVGIFKSRSGEEVSFPTAAPGAARVRGQSAEGAKHDQANDRHTTSVA